MKKQLCTENSKLITRGEPWLHFSANRINTKSQMLQSISYLASLPGCPFAVLDEREGRSDVRLQLIQTQRLRASTLRRYESMIDA